MSVGTDQNGNHIFLTAGHAATGKESFVNIIIGQSKYRASILYTHNANYSADIAVLSIPDHGMSLKRWKIHDGILKTGMAIKWVSSGGINWTSRTRWNRIPPRVVSGRITEIRKEMIWIKPGGLYGGESGSPVLVVDADNVGQVVGIIGAGDRKSSWATNLTAIRHALRQAGVVLTYQQKTASTDPKPTIQNRSAPVFEEQWRPSRPVVQTYCPPPSRPPVQTIVQRETVDYVRLTQMIVARIKVEGLIKSGADGKDGEDAEVDYEKLVTLILEKIKSEKLIKNIKGDQGDKGDRGEVTVIIKRYDPKTKTNKELFRLKNVESGSHIEVPVELYEKKKSNERSGGDNN